MLKGFINYSGVVSANASVIENCMY